MTLYFRFLSSTYLPFFPKSIALETCNAGVDVEELRADNDELRRQNAELEAKAQSKERGLCRLGHKNGAQNLGIAKPISKNRSSRAEQVVLLTSPTISPKPEPLRRTFAKVLALKPAILSPETVNIPGKPPSPKSRTPKHRSLY